MGYRYFGVSGRLVGTGGRVIEVFRTVHADDLPDGVAALPIVAARVLADECHQHDDDGATWAAPPDCREVFPTTTIDTPNP